MTRPGLAAMLLLLAAAPAFAAEPSGCDNFKWPIARERAALTAADRQNAPSGAELPAPPASAVLLALRDPAEAALPSPPERAPKPGSFAGFLRIREIAKAGSYTVSLSQPGWIDAVQNGAVLKPADFSGAGDCDGIRKSVKYQFAAGPLLLQISGSPTASIAVALLPAQ
ncbi:MAG TPA: hypothetical protein VGC77_03955 [Rhodopseudomonas sp.]